MDKPKYLIPSILITGILISCGTSPKMAKVGLSQPNTKHFVDTAYANLPKQITYIDKEGKEQIITKADLDSITGEYMTSVQLDGITVMAQSKNVAERNGKVDLDFVVTVPGQLINNKWQVQLTPIAYKKNEKIELDKIFLSGADFAKMQKKGYLEYQEFINSIIPDSLYLQEMFNKKGFNKALQDLENEYYQNWKSQVTSHAEYSDWFYKTNRRFELFNGIMERNKQRIEGIRTFKRHLPSHWLYRDFSAQYVPGKWRLFLDEKFSIKPRIISPEDSAKIEKQYYDYKRIAENQRKIEMKDYMYNKLVRFPYQKARLDTIIRKGDNFVYYYQQEMPVDDNVKRIDLTLDGLIITKNEDKFKLPPSDTLTYYISSMLTFADTNIRYKDTIISRKDEVTRTAYIKYEAGKTEFIAKLGNNKEEINKIFETIKGINYTGEFLIDSIYMTASASPEGNAALNLQLSKGRAINLKQYLATTSDDREGVDTIFRPRWIGEDWGKLYRLVYEDNSIGHKKEILEIMNVTKNLDQREQLIRQFKADYEYIRGKYYPELRTVDFKFHLHRRGMIKDTIHTQVVDERYKQGYELLQNRQYKEALTILNDYPSDYNLGLCLMSLGYDQRALNIMLQQPVTADRDYLIAILYSRLKNEPMAVKYYMSSCDKDSSKIWRGKLDPEINKLIVTYNLYKNELEDAN